MKLSDRINPDRLLFAARSLSVSTHPIRAEIIRMLHKVENMSAIQIQEEMKLKQADTSFHLLLLYQYGILKRERQRKAILYTVNKKKIDEIVKISEFLSTR